MKIVKHALDKLKSNPVNPRTISPERMQLLGRQLERFGDIGGVILNLTTGHLCGGHQRVELFRGWKGEIVYTTRHKKPTRCGTVAEGYVEIDGERFSYREVRWPAETERLAMLAANNPSGEWDNAMLGEFLKGMDSQSDMTGFTDEEFATLIKTVSAPDNFKVIDENLAIEHKCPSCGYQWSGKSV